MLLLIHYCLYRLFGKVGRSWPGKSFKASKRSRLKQQLRDFTLPMVDRLLLIFLRGPESAVWEKLDPEKIWTKAFAAWVCFRGRLFLNMDLYPEALTCFWAVAPWHPDPRKIGYLIGLAAQLAGRLPEAEQAYRFSLTCEKYDDQNKEDDDASALLNLGHVLLILGKEEEAAQFLFRAIEKNPKLSMAHQNFAGLYNYNKYVPRSLDLMRDPRIALYDACNIVGERLIHVGRGEEGLRFFGKAIQQQRSLAAEMDLPGELKSRLMTRYGIGMDAPIRILPYEWVTLIGHIGLLDTYLKLQQLGMSAQGKPVLLAPKVKVANPAYLDLWRQYFCVVEDETLVNDLFPYQRLCGDSFNGYITNEGVARCWTELGAQGHIRWDGAGKEPLLKLPEKLLERGYAKLREFGIKKGDWFVALHARSGSYHRESKHFIQKHRNADLSDYAAAIRKITERGGYVIRMGDRHMEPAPKLAGLIDYPHSDAKSAWMDIFLAGAARFFIGTTSGLTNAVISLGTPCLLVNCISNYFQLWNNRVLFIFKPLWNKKEQRFLRVSEMTHNAFRWKLFNINQLDELGIIPQTNTAEEIASATSEMLARLEKGVVMDATDADRTLREQCELSGNRDYFADGRISRSFYETRKKDLFTA
ncbi:MAG TPA: TIGR04372 family glycosyltransferase [Candidatus Omnitrophota bacterium]|nr:TIGR04372 family glycosyltransferase [Candidatus Omnitrophota bacterium]